MLPRWCLGEEHPVSQEHLNQSRNMLTYHQGKQDREPHNGSMGVQHPLLPSIRRPLDHLCQGNWRQLAVNLVSACQCHWAQWRLATSGLRLETSWCAAELHISGGETGKAEAIQGRRHQPPPPQLKMVKPKVQTGPRCRNTPL